VDQSSPNFFVERSRKRCSAPNFQTLNIFIRFGDIRAQSGEVSKIAPNLACFLAPQKIFFGGRPPNFWTGIYKLNLLSNVWQNFAEIGSRTLEISRWKKETAA